MARFGVGEVIGSTFRTVFGNLSTFVTTQGTVLIGWLVVSLILQLVVFNASMDAVLTAFASGDMASALAALGPLMAASLVMLVGSVIVYAASTGLGIVAADAAMRGERVTFGEAWSRVKPRFGNILGTMALLFVIVLALMLAGAIGAILIVPILAAIAAVLYFLARWAVAFPVSVLETRSVTGNLGRASELTAGSRGAIFGTLVVLFLIILIPALVIVLPLTLATTPTVDPSATTLDAADLQPSIGMQVAQWAVNGVLQLLSSFLGAALTVILYRRLLPPEPAPAPPATTEPRPVY